MAGHRGAMSQGWVPSLVACVKPCVKGRDRLGKSLVYRRKVDQFVRRVSTIAHPCGNAISLDQSGRWSGDRSLNGTLPGWSNRVGYARCCTVPEDLTGQRLAAAAVGVPAGDLAG
jgi:hypothetical protein